MTATKATRKFSLPFENETKIPLKAVCSLKNVFVEPPGYCKVNRWVKNGVYGIKLEAHREGRAIYTSVEAVHRFLQRGNGDRE